MKLKSLMITIIYALCGCWILSQSAFAQNNPYGPDKDWMLGSMDEYIEYVQACGEAKLAIMGIHGEFSSEEKAQLIHEYIREENDPLEDSEVEFLREYLKDHRGQWQPVFMPQILISDLRGQFENYGYDIETSLFHPIAPDGFLKGISVRALPKRVFLLTRQREMPLVNSEENRGLPSGKAAKATRNGTKAAASAELGIAATQSSVVAGEVGLLAMMRKKAYKGLSHFNQIFSGATMKNGGLKIAMGLTFFDIGIYQLGAKKVSEREKTLVRVVHRLRNTACPILLRDRELGRLILKLRNELVKKLQKGEEDFAGTALEGIT